MREQKACIHFGVVSVTGSLSWFNTNSQNIIIGFNWKIIKNFNKLLALETKALAIHWTNTKQ